MSKKYTILFNPLKLFDDFYNLILSLNENINIDKHLLFFENIFMLY